MFRGAERLRDMHMIIIRVAAAGLLALAAGCVTAPDDVDDQAADPLGAGSPSACPSAERAEPFDAADALETRLAAIGCGDKTLVSHDHDGREWFTASCPRGAENRALVAAYRAIEPYHLRVVARACAGGVPAGFDIDEWDPHGDPW